MDPQQIQAIHSLIDDLQQAADDAADAVIQAQNSEDLDDGELQFTYQIEAAGSDDSPGELVGIVWASGQHNLWVNGEPTKVHVPEDTITETFQRVQERMEAGEPPKIGFDHPDDDSVAAQTALGEIGVAQEFTQDTLDDGREAITMRESELTNSKAVEAAEAGSFEGFGFSIVGNIALATTEEGQVKKRDDGSLQVAATDIHRVDVVPDQAVEGAKNGNLPKLAEAASAAGRMAASSPRQKSGGLVATLRAASSSIEAQNGSDGDGRDEDHGNTDANTSLISEMETIIADHDSEESELISQMASEAGIEEGTVREILSDAGGIQCPPMQRLEGFASVLDVSADRLVSAAEDGGCNYGDTEAHDSKMTDTDFPTDPDSLEAAQTALSQASEAVEAKDEQIEDLEAQVSSLSDEAEHFRQIAASQGVDPDADEFSPQDVVDAFSEDLRAEIADLEAALPKYDTEDQESRTSDLAGKPLSELEAMAGERWREFGRSKAKRDELSAAVAADESVGSVESAGSSNGADADDAARSVMTAREIHAASSKDQQPSEFIEAEYGISPTEYDSEAELQAAISGGEN